MYKSCNACGKIHPVGFKCAKKIIRKKDGKKEDDFRASQAWKNKRKEIQERDNFCCLYCKCTADDYTKDMFNQKDLSVHHIVPLREDFERRLDDNNLITLCRLHHEMAEKGSIERSTLLNMVAQISPPDKF